jgi:hypothetical protein
MEEILDDRSPKTGDGMPKNLPNANATLVLGIISIATCWLYGLPGLVCGIIALVLYGKDKKLYLTDPQAYENSYKNSKAGHVCAIIGVSLSALFFVYIIVIFAIVGTAFMAAASA